MLSATTSGLRSRVSQPSARATVAVALAARGGASTASASVAPSSGELNVGRGVCRMREKRGPEIGYNCSA